MSIAYYVDRIISENLSETPEKFLVCKQVNIARTGTQKYLRSEIGDDSGDPNDLVTVYRSPDEVFKQSVLDSAQAKPVTDDHPKFFVNSTNFSDYQKGTVSNVRIGDILPDGNRALVADLIIYDELLKAKILGGKRGLSCGYSTSYAKDDLGRWQQVGILINHVAVCKNPRGGDSIIIRDHAHALEVAADNLAVVAETVKTEIAAIAAETSSVADAPAALVPAEANLVNIRVEPEQPKKDRIMTSNSPSIITRMLSVFAKTAGDDELQEALQHVTAASPNQTRRRTNDEDPEPDDKKAKDKKAKDDDEEKELLKKRASDAEAKVEKLEKEKKDAADAKAATDAKVKDSEEGEARKEDGMELHPTLQKACDSIEEHGKMLSDMKDSMDDLKDHLGMESGEATSEDADLIPGVVEPLADRPKNTIPGADSKATGDAMTTEAIRASLKAMKPAVVQSNDAAAIDSWNQAWKATKPAQTRGTNGHAALLNANRPNGVPSGSVTRTNDSAGAGAPIDQAAIEDQQKKIDAARARLQGKVN